MKLEQQVLPVEQVKELIDLGFDVSKHASMKLIGNNLILTKETGYYGVENIVPTLSIGDIMEILPAEIIDKDEDCNFYLYELEIINNSISYYGFDIEGDIFSSGKNKTFIDALFETLKWCIKNKHIAL